MDNRRRPSLDFWIWIVVASTIVIVASVAITLPQRVTPVHPPAALDPG